MSTSRVLLLNDDWGGRVCPQCQTANADYVDTLFAYSAYTKQDPVRGDTLFLAAQTHEHRTVMVEFSRVPYRLFLAPQDFRTIALRGEMVHAEFRHCIRTLDSFCHQQQEFVEVRFYSRCRYMDAYDLLVNAKLPVVIDGAHDALHGLDAVLNLGIPGACGTLRFKSMAAVHVTDSHWRIDAPANVCIHGILPRMPVLQRVMSIAWNVDGTMSIGFDKQEERYEVAKAREVAAIVEKFHPTVVLVREKEKTLLRLHQSAPAIFFALLSLLPCCPPSPPGGKRPYLPGLGVLAIDVATELGLTMDAPMNLWLDGYRSSEWLKDCWNRAVASRTGMHDYFGAYEAFTAAMVLRYALTRTVCELAAEARANYTGGLTIPPRPSLELEGPVAVFDFVSMYPSIACIINAGNLCHGRRTLGPRRRTGWVFDGSAW